MTGSQNRASNGQKSSRVPQYVRPSSGIVGLMPDAWVPYAELMRLDKPVGIYSFYMPHMVGSLWASSVMYSELPPLAHVFYINAILYFGTIFMRGAACSWNDNLDQEYDRQVFRCKTRPIARGAISTFNGHMFTVFLTAVAAFTLFLLPRDCLVFAAPSIFLLWLYPFGKRFTDYPQLILGFQMSFGVPVGVAAMGVSVEEILGDRSLYYLFMSLVAWTVVYDTVYARQDVRDDAKAGVKSMAVKFKSWTRQLLSLFAILEVSLLALAGMAAPTSDLGLAYFIVACGGTALSLVTMLYYIKLEEPADCMWWFQQAYWHTGLPIALGLSFKYYRVKLLP